MTSLKEAEMLQKMILSDRGKLLRDKMWVLYSVTVEKASKMIFSRKKITLEKGF